MIERTVALRWFSGLTLRALRLGSSTVATASLVFTTNLC